MERLLPKPLTLERVGVTSNDEFTDSQEEASPVDVISLAFICHFVKTESSSYLNDFIVVI